MQVKKNKHVAERQIHPETKLSLRITKRKGYHIKLLLRITSTTPKSGKNAVNPGKSHQIITEKDL